MNLHVNFWTARERDRTGMPHEIEARLRLYYPTQESAVAATEVVLRDLARTYQARIDRYNVKRPPDAARKAYDDPRKHACEIHLRVVEFDVTRLSADENASRQDERHARVRLEPVLERRHRWREAHMTKVVHENGEIEITHSLAKPGEWGPWDRGGGHIGDGEPYIPSVVVEVFAIEYVFGAGVKEVCVAIRAAEKG